MQAEQSLKALPNKVGDDEGEEEEEEKEE